MLLVFMKASGFLSSIWYHWMCHPFHYVNVSCGSSGNLTTFLLLCLHDHLVSHSRNLLRRRIGSFNRQASSLTNDIPPPISKAGLCFCSLNPLQQPLQPDALHHPAMVTHYCYCWHIMTPLGQIAITVDINLSLLKSVSLWMSPIYFKPLVGGFCDPFNFLPDAVQGSDSVLLLPVDYLCRQTYNSLNIFFRWTINKPAFLIACVVVVEIAVKPPPSTIRFEDFLRETVPWCCKPHTFPNVLGQFPHPPKFKDHLFFHQIHSTYCNFANPLFLKHKGHCVCPLKWMDVQSGHSISNSGFTNGCRGVFVKAYAKLV